MASVAHASPKMSYEFFAQAHRRLLDGAEARSLDADIPRFSKNLEIALAVSAEHWSDSTPYDELAKQYVLSEKICTALRIPLLEAGGVRHAPAGLMHTYGYLFSQLQTAYGLKGKRWIESRLDERLGLPAGVFSPFTTQGEFLSNVTSVFFKVIGAPKKLAHAARLAPKARLSGTLTEHVVWQTPEGREVQQAVRTHLVRLEPLKDFATQDAELLIYEVEEDGRRRLVTGFPVDASFAEGIMKSGPVADTSFRPRYNLFVDPRWKVVAHRSEGFSAAANQ